MVYMIIVLMPRRNIWSGGLGLIRLVLLSFFVVWLFLCSPRILLVSLLSLFLYSSFLSLPSSPIPLLLSFPFNTFWNLPQQTHLFLTHLLGNGIQTQDDGNTKGHVPEYFKNNYLADADAYNERYANRYTAWFVGSQDGESYASGCAKLVQGIARPRSTFIYYCFCFHSSQTHVSFNSTYPCFCVFNVWNDICINIQEIRTSL